MTRARIPTTLAGEATAARLTRLGARARVPGQLEMDVSPTPRCVSVDGFSLHANGAVHGNDRKGLEHMCLYVARPPVVRERLKLRPNGTVYYRFKKP